MHIHNFLVDFRNSLNKHKPDKITEDQIFDYDRLDNAIISSVVTSDSTCPVGITSNDEVNFRMNGLLLRDHLMLSFHNHNMHRSTKS